MTPTAPEVREMAAPSETEARRLAASFRTSNFTDTADMLDWLADQVWPEKYGRRNVAKMIAEIDALRKAIRAFGTPEIQTAWDQVEEHIDYGYQRK